jgi:chemotaxis protein CheZ
MNQSLLDNGELVSWLNAMSRALADRNETALSAALTGFEAARMSTVTTQVRRVANNLQFALDHFQTDSKLMDLAQRQAPDARLRLAHVLRLTDDAAHRTMDLVERSCPLADHASTEAERLMLLQQQGTAAQQMMPQLAAFVTVVATTMGVLRNNLAEVLLAQGYQDISGQIVRSVMKLIQELELALADLLRIAGPEDMAAAVPASPTAGQGPVVPGVPQPSAVTGQLDVDALLTQMGV